MISLIVLFSIQTFYSEMQVEPPILTGAYLEQSIFESSRANDFSSS